MPSSNPFRRNRERLSAMNQLTPKNQKAAEERAEEQKRRVNCPDCNANFADSRLEGTLYRCPECGHMFKMPARARLAMVFDDGEYEELDPDLVGGNPINFPDYEKKIEAAREETSMNEAVLCAVGYVGGHRAVVAVLDSKFMMGSMGVAVGEKITRAVEFATSEGLPLIIFSASGGARMQEGIYSLMQMAKTSAAVQRHDEAGLLYISVMTNPTTGGVTASFASLGDIIIAEPEALIGFAGPRVIEQTIGQSLPEGFQRAEYLLDHGFLDAIVEREDLKEWLVLMLDIHLGNVERETYGAYGEAADAYERAAASSAADGDATASAEGGDEGDGQADAGDESQQESSSSIMGSIAHGVSRFWKSMTASPSKRVELARAQDRPHADFFIDELFNHFVEFHGDRLDKDDHSIKGGVAYFHDVPVTVIAQCKGSDVEQNIDYNFGMPNPQGYRKVQRLARQAEKFSRPVITIIDTPGAYPGIEAEEKGQGEAIAKCIELFSALKTPVIALFIGEGGSGGALAMGVANSIIMLENSIFSILSPEGFASILWKDSSRSKEAASVMKLTAGDLKQYGIADIVIPEGGERLVAPCEDVILRIDSALVQEIIRLAPLDGETLANQRYEKFRSIGSCYELEGDGGR